MGNKPIWEALAQRNYNSHGKMHLHSSNTIRLDDIRQFTTFGAQRKYFKIEKMYY